MNENSAHMQVLTPPAPVPPVKTENAGQMVQLDPAILLDLDDQAEQFINDTLTLERHDPVFKERIESIHPKNGSYPAERAGKNCIAADFSPRRQRNACWVISLRRASGDNCSAAFFNRSRKPLSS